MTGDYRLPTMLKLTKNINHITKYEDSFFFFGDTNHGYESRAPEADIKIIIEYIDYCQEQLKLAQEYLKLNKKDGK